MPAYNEESRLPSALDNPAELLRQRRYHFTEVLVVDGGSSDRTVEVVQQYAGKWPALCLSQNPGNRGKGYAVRHGIPEARADWVFFTGADLSTPIDEIDHLRAAITDAPAARQISRAKQIDRFGFDVTTLSVANMQRLKLVDMPIRWNDWNGICR